MSSLPHKYSHPLVQLPSLTQTSNIRQAEKHFKNTCLIIMLNIIYFFKAINLCEPITVLFMRRTDNNFPLNIKFNTFYCTSETPFSRLLEKDPFGVDSSITALNGEKKSWIRESNCSNATQWTIGRGGINSQNHLNWKRPSSSSSLTIRSSNPNHQKMFVILFWLPRWVFDEKETQGPILTVNFQAISTQRSNSLFGIW